MISSTLVFAQKKSLLLRKFCFFFCFIWRRIAICGVLWKIFLLYSHISFGMRLCTGVTKMTNRGCERLWEVPIFWNMSHILEGSCCFVICKDCVDLNHLVSKDHLGSVHRIGEIQHHVWVLFLFSFPNHFYLPPIWDKIFLHMGLDSISLVFHSNLLISNIS